MTKRFHISGCKRASIEKTVRNAELWLRPHQGIFLLFHKKKVGFIFKLSLPITYNYIPDSLSNLTETF